MLRDTKPISWIEAARKDVETFPDGTQLERERALTIVAEGRHPDIAKPLTGIGTGVFEVALRFRTNAYRVVYAVQPGDAVWVVHAFQKKSKTGIKTPKAEIDLARERIRRLKEVLR